MKKVLIISLAIIAFLHSNLYAQYYGERVMEKSFEQADFFFTPNYLNPIGLKGFLSVSPGLVNDPLLNLQINPANLYSDTLTQNYAYIDFRGTRTKIDKNYYVMPMYTAEPAYSSSHIRYPLFYARSRKELEPVVSGAFLSRPLQQQLPGLFVGLTYQMIFQDEKYYSIPMDIYKSNLAYDYAGNRTMAADASIPIVDKYSGTDNMRQKGHLLMLFSGYDVTPDLQIGFRLGRTTFTRDGSYGSKNFWEYYYGSRASTSVWHNLENREQEYNHWDFAGGVNYKLTYRLGIGITAGRLWGKATQSLTRLDTSLYLYGQVNVTTDWSYSRRYATTDQSWIHDGGTSYGGANLNLKLTELQEINLFYHYTQQAYDITLGSDIVDSSTSSYQYQSGSTTYKSQWDYKVLDNRTGVGDKKGNIHRFLGVYRHILDYNLTLDVGLSFESRTFETNTEEPVTASRLSKGYYSYGSYNYFNSVEEVKNLYWNFKTSQTLIQVPIIVNWKTSDKVAFLFGLNRRIIDWEIEETTLAIFKYRNTDDGTTKVSKTNFGERYTIPKENMSDIETILLAGITFTPTKFFGVRLLVSPSQLEKPYEETSTDFHWWISVTLRP